MYIIHTYQRPHIQFSHENTHSSILHSRQINQSDSPDDSVILYNLRHDSSESRLSVEH